MSSVKADATRLDYRHGTVAIGLAIVGPTTLWLIEQAPWPPGELCLTNGVSIAQALLIEGSLDPAAWRMQVLHGLIMAVAMTPPLLYEPVSQFARARHSAASCAMLTLGFVTSWTASGCLCLAIAAMLQRVTSAAFGVALAAALLSRGLRFAASGSGLSEPAFDAGLRVGRICALRCGALTITCFLLPMNAFAVMAGLMALMTLDRQILHRDAARAEPLS